MDKFEENVIKKFNIEEQNKFHIRNIWFGSYIPYHKMEDVVKQLKKNYRLVIFSGNVRERVEFLDNRYDFLKYFDDVVFSFDYQKDKNDIEFYEELINHINCEPSQAILVDDEKKNIRRAQSVGLNGILYYYTEHFVEQLKKFGIELEV
jgi:HAD superfamily hydrolase (TIGR01509 family)